MAILASVNGIHSSRSSGIFRIYFLLIKCLNQRLEEEPQSNQAQGERRRKLKLDLLNATFQIIQKEI